VVWAKHDDAAAMNEALPRAAGIVVRTYTQVNDELLDKAPNLQVVGRAGVGLDNIDLDACKKRGVKVVYTPDANTQAVVEYVTGLMLDELRPRPNLLPPLPPGGGRGEGDQGGEDRDASGREQSDFHFMRKHYVGRQLSDLTLGILGFGRIGKRIGEVAHAIGMNIRVNDLLPEVELRKHVDYAFEFVGPSVLLAQCDILTIHVDGRPSNRHLINAEALAMLRPNCLLINTSRGFVIDPAALAGWAKQHHHARAVLDVHDPEPPPKPPEYPLWSAPNVRLLPHLASRTNTALENMSWVVRDVVAVLKGQKPEFPA
jgi:phosphoglycerate dehydrogenase-like enzyme